LFMVEPQEAEVLHLMIFIYSTWEMESRWLSGWLFQWLARLLEEGMDTP
jgi:hypothetical protein